MNLRFVTALNRRRLRRRLLIESARLEEMEANAKETLDAQKIRVQEAEAALDRAIGTSSADVARRLDLECKAPLLAA
ncbi:MAG: hypothetical protein AzoDbin1_02126 [Azoarcus sp.]|nr:hypothetical protein [Azoarcus sp.]